MYPCREPYILTGTPSSKMSDSYIQDPRNQTTESEFHTIIAIQRTSALLSLCGSLYIIRAITWKDPSREKRLTMYHRIVFVLSCFDVASSLSLLVASWSIPHDAVYSFLHGNYGNTATCDAQGFLLLFGWLGVMTSNSALCLNFLLTIKYNWSNAKLKQRLERPFHAILLFFCLPLAATPFFLDLFNPALSFCMMTIYPKECINNSDDNDIECLRGERGAFQIVYILHYGFPVPAAFLTITVSMIMLYRSVKQQERQAIQIASDATLRRLSRHSKKVFWRATWYVVSFLVVWVPGFIIISTNYSVVLQYFAKFTLPLQGTRTLYVQYEFDFVAFA